APPRRHRREAAHAPDDPARGLGPRLRERAPLRARLRLTAPPKAGGRPDAAADAPDRAGARLPSRRPDPPGLGRRERELEQEGRAGAAVRLDPDPPVHALDELPADVEAQAGTADAAALVRVQPDELLEDALLASARDPEPFVAHFDAADTVVGHHDDVDVAAVG